MAVGYRRKITPAFLDFVLHTCAKLTLESATEPEVQNVFEKYTLQTSMRGSVRRGGSKPVVSSQSSQAASQRRLLVRPTPKVHVVRVRHLLELFGASFIRVLE